MITSKTIQVEQYNFSQLGAGIIIWNEKMRK